jgi:hypothetical protein
MLKTSIYVRIKRWSGTALTPHDQKLFYYTSHEANCTSHVTLSCHLHLTATSLLSHYLQLNHSTTNVIIIHMFSPILCGACGLCVSVSLGDQGVPRPG